MRHFRLIFLSVLLLLVPATAGASAHGKGEAEPVTAFVHVNVVPMDRERVLSDQTVIVEGGIITAIGPGLPVPAGARVIDGRKSAYLSPGLADMHVHSDSRNDLAVYLANGVTSVLTMGGTRASFVASIVPAANAGRLPSPHIYTSFKVDGSTDNSGFVVRTPEEARAVVGLAKSNGYDFIKVYVDLAPAVYEALADEGRRLGVPLVGHGVRSVRLERQLALGQPLLAHAEEFFYTFYTLPNVAEGDAPPDAARIPEAVALVRRYGATVTADLVTYHRIQAQIGHPELVEAALARPEASLLSPNDRLVWLRSGYATKTARLADKLEFLRKLMKAMSDAGLPLITGTDAPTIPGVLPGFSLHDNLDELEAAGLGRYQALSMATRQAGEFIARTKGGTPFGTVAVGSRADLVLSQTNPLETLATLRAPLGVMAGGAWYDGDALAALLADVRQSYCAATGGPVYCRTPRHAAGK